MDFEGGPVSWASCVWRSDDGEPWLVTFSLVEVGGRAECVGVEVRSYLRRMGDALGQATWRPGAPAGGGQEIGWELEDDWAALNAGAERVLGLPRPLRAKTLRGLPFAEVLTRARRDYAGGLRHVAQGLREAAREPLSADLERYVAEAEAGPQPDVRARLAEKVERTADSLIEEARSVASPHLKDGRRARYTVADLERVAAVYSAAYADGSTSPAKDVADALGLTRNVARKLIQQCRDPKVGLLAPTQKRKAGGILPPTGEGER